MAAPMTMTFLLSGAILAASFLFANMDSSALLAPLFALGISRYFFDVPAFVTLFVVRYLRLVVNLFSFWFWYRPAPVDPRPNYHRHDVTVIIPTVAPRSHAFFECLVSVLRQGPAAILIVTVGAGGLEDLEQVAIDLRPQFPNTRIGVGATTRASKRAQVAHAIPHVKTDITVLVDDSVVWPSATFLDEILAPFESVTVGLVGTNKRVRRETPGQWSMPSLCNLFGCLYLTRHNFEIRASNAVPGERSVFVISGRTAAHRTRVIQDENFLVPFTNERFFFGLFGPLNADDDNFITRYYVMNDWDIRIQYTEDSVIETSLGVYPKFRSQLMRWARTTWRSNPALLLRGGSYIWAHQPWSVYAVYLSGLWNFALIWDAVMVYAFFQDERLWQGFDASWTHLAYLLLWIFGTCLLFGYVHSVIKLWAMLTFWDCSWGGRNLAAVDADAGSAPDVPVGFLFDISENWQGYHFYKQ